MAKTKAINLLPQQEFEASTIGRVLKWAMSTFRIIVIITEMIVMGAFLSRFWLDARNSDLNDEIKIKSAQIEAQSGFEKEFRNIQKKLSIFKTLSEAKKPTEIVEAMTSSMPSEVSLSSFSVQNDSAQIKGSSGSEIGIAQFISNLKTNPSVKNIELEQVNSSENNPSLLIFTIKVSI